MNIDTLEGRQLDLAIERYVFGNKQPPIDKWCWIQDDNGTWWSEQQDCVDGEWLRSWSHVEWPPHYHSSVFLAFQVVDKLIECGFCSNVILEGHNLNLWWCGFRTGTYIDGCSWSTKRPIAICRAALKVVCNES